MKAIIENNKVRLVTDFSTVECNIIVPFANIEKMKQLTNCKIKEVKETKVSFNHNAGRLAIVKMTCRIDVIEKFLNTEQVYKCENFEEYKNLLGKGGCDSYSSMNLISCNSAKLYAFGDLCLNYKFTNNNTHYINKNGRKISLNGKNDNYVNFKGEWFRKLNKTA